MHMREHTHIHTWHLAQRTASECVYVCVYICFYIYLIHIYHLYTRTLIYV